MSEADLNNIYRFVALMATSEEYFSYVSEALLNMEAAEYKKKLILDKKPIKPYQFSQIDKEVERFKKEYKKTTESTKKFFGRFSNNFKESTDENMLQLFIDGLHEKLSEIKLKQNETII